MCIRDRYWARDMQKELIAILAGVFGTTTADPSGTPVSYTHLDVYKRQDVDGTIISEVSKGKDGVKVKLADRMKAFDLTLVHREMFRILQRGFPTHIDNRSILECGHQSRLLRVLLHN